MHVGGTRRFVILIGLGVALLALPQAALAGPPLLCHPYDTGGARSLPWGSSGGWNSPVADYPLDGLVSDTLALLTPETPVVARMETIRRATIYASRDVRVAADLVSVLSRRALERRGLATDRHAWFDFGFLVETYKQADFLFTSGNPAADIDGYRHIIKAINVGSGLEPEMELAAALTTARSRRDVAQAHYRRAASGATVDPILARNLSLFPDK